MKRVEYCILVNGYLIRSYFDESRAIAERNKLADKYPHCVYTIKTNEYTEAEYQRYFVRGEY